MSFDRHRNYDRIYPKASDLTERQTRQKFRDRSRVADKITIKLNVPGLAGDRSIEHLDPPTPHCMKQTIDGCSVFFRHPIFQQYSSQRLSFGKGQTPRAPDPDYDFANGDRG
ncbi:hypothetical protein CKA32_003623 [Geitlerinema sp. FC II]|nr:hypothetical protein CKA32_003623 [Geitlerinema sp. FC II]